MITTANLTSLKKRMYNRFFTLYFSTAQWKYRLSIWLSAIVIAIVAVFFAKAAIYIQHFYLRIFEHSIYLALLLMPLGFMMLIFLQRQFFPYSQGSGISETITMLSTHHKSLRSNFLSLRTAIGKMLLTIGSIGCGASFGSEGPTVQIGAAITYWFGDKFQALKNESIERSLIIAGSAAGVAAAFNTPLAGIIFVIEEFGIFFEGRYSEVILSAVIICVCFSSGLIGQYNYFNISTLTYTASVDYFSAALIGILCGIAGALTILLLRVFSHSIFIQYRHKSPLIWAGVCGLLLAMIGIFSEGMTFGTGYQQTREILINDFFDPHSLFGFLKILSLILSQISGVIGGSLAPALAIGAGLGDFFSHFLSWIPRNTLIILAMVGFFSALIRAPVTGAVIVMEITESYSLLLLLLLSAFLAKATSKQLMPRSWFFSQPSPTIGQSHKEPA